MKLQINGKNLRLRIDEDELQQLLADTVLSSTTPLPGEKVFAFSLRLHAGTDAVFDPTVDAWLVGVPRAVVEAYTARLPCRDGLTFLLETGTPDTLELGFEVDVRDSVRRRKPRASR